MHNGGAMEWIMFPSRGDSLGLGVLCAILLRSELWHSVKGYAGFIAVSAVIWLTAAKLFIRTGTLAAFSPKYTCFGLVYASVLLLALTRRFHLVSAILNSPPLQFLGRVSYFVYLAHLAIREAAFRWIPGFWMPTLVGCVVTLGLSELSWRVLEKPLVKRGHRTKYIV